MDAAALQEIVDSLPSGRTLFHYFPDRYALLLLKYAVGEGRTIAELKRSRWAALLKKPVMRELVAGVGTRPLTGEKLDAVWPESTRAYRLTLGKWPNQDERWQRRWHQMTRKGHHLVLQLNLTKSHVRELKRIMDDPDLLEDYIDSYHPVASGGELTLAWARIDLEMDRGEALVEEIQSDWVRDAKSYARWGGSSEDLNRWQVYCDTLLAPYVKLWDECMLAAAVWFLVEEIGIRRVFYHTYKSGAQLKHIEGRLPPRSLYTRLPRRFCFEETCNGPTFLRDVEDRGLRKAFRDMETRWHLLDFSMSDECGAR